MQPRQDSGTVPKAVPYAPILDRDLIQTNRPSSERAGTLLKPLLHWYMELNLALPEADRNIAEDDAEQVLCHLNERLGTPATVTDPDLLIDHGAHTAVFSAYLDATDETSASAQMTAAVAEAIRICRSRLEAGLPGARVLARPA